MKANKKRDHEADDPEYTGAHKKRDIADNIADWLEANLTRLYIEWKGEGCPGTWTAYAASAVRAKWGAR
jgi:hypothetical protein